MSKRPSRSSLRIRLSSRLRSQRGESLVESIVAFAVITAILVAFGAFVQLGSNLTAQTAQTDANTSSPLNNNAGTGTASIDGQPIGTVTVYSNNGNVYRYEVQAQ